MSESRMAARGRFDLRQDFWRVVAILLMLVLLNIAFYLFLNLPRLRALSDLSSGRDEVRRALLETNRSTQSMQDLKARYDQENTRLDQFYAERLGTQIEHMTRIQQGVRAIAAEFRVDPESIDYNSSEIEDSDLTRFQITVPLIGGYPNLRHFINRIETAPFLATIDSIELAGSRDGGAMLSLTIRISTYFLSPVLTPEEAEAGTPASVERPAGTPKRPRR